MNDRALLPQHADAQILERALASNPDAERAFSAHRLLADDESERFPAEACGVLEELGTHAFYVPVAQGGRFASCEQLLTVLRVIARRDLTVAIGHTKTFLGSAPVWIGGSEAQRAELAKSVLRREPVALALTERAHGADLLAVDVEATPNLRGFSLQGEKWLVNNATRASTVCVFARTEAEPGARSGSVLLVEKAKLARGSFSHLPKIRTHGIRGADISGLRFNDAELGEESCIGGRGAGLELTLKTLQVTRTLCAGLSLGAADAALRIALGFATSRRLYRSTVYDLAAPRSMLVDALVDLFICECTSIGATRAIHTATSQMSVVSAVTKYFVPTVIEQQISQLSVVLGARHYLREGDQTALFQKVARDNSLVALFDGSTMVNLSALALQLHALSRNRPSHERRARLERTFSLRCELPTLVPSQLELTSFGEDDAVQGLDHVLESLQEGRLGAESDTARAIERVTRELVGARNGLFADVRTLHEQLGARASQERIGFVLARRYAAIHAASACLQLYVNNPHVDDPFFMAGHWVVACVERILARLDPSLELRARSHEDSLAERMLELHRESRLFSVLPFQVGEGLA